MDNIGIRRASVEDAAQLLNIYAYYVENTAITFEYDVPSLEEFRARMESILKKYPYLVAVYGGEIVGFTYAAAFRGRAAYGWSAETTIYVAPEMRRRGLGRSLYTALENALEKMGVLNLYACIGYPEAEDEYLNKNSAQFHARMGYRTCGEFRRCGYKFGRWYGMVWMEKIIAEHTQFPPDILAYPDIAD